MESIVREQLHSLVEQSEAEEVATMSGLPRSKDSLGLERWLIARALNGSRNYRELTSVLRSLAHDRTIPEWLQISVNRWANNCESWSNTPARTDLSLSGLTAHELLKEGRQRFFEAAGFKKIGRSYDAAVLNLWVIRVLTQFVEKNPYHPEIPEALYMLGDAYIDLGTGLPPQVKADRVINLCSELYPDSVWANRANSLWREQYTSDENHKARKELNHEI